MYFNSEKKNKKTFDKELKHRPFVFKCRENNTSEVKTQALFFF